MSRPFAISRRAVLLYAPAQRLDLVREVLWGLVAFGVLPRCSSTSVWRGPQSSFVNSPGGAPLREMRFDLGIIEIGAGVCQGLTHLVAEPAVVRLLLSSSSGSIPSLAVRVSRIRTASETVRPIFFSSTAVALSFTSASMRVWTTGPTNR
jgi:hypothetical protein